MYYEQLKQEIASASVDIDEAIFESDKYKMLTRAQQNMILVCWCERRHNFFIERNEKSDQEK